MNLLLRYYSLKRLHLFILVVLLNLIIIWLSRSVLINETVFYNTYSEQLTYDRAMNLFERMKDFSWISYAFTPILLLIKFSLISMVLYTGVVFCNLQDKISLGSVFKIVIGSEIIFVIAGFLKFLWFYLFAGNYDLNELGFFYPVSLINLFKESEVSNLWRYPLQTVNLFHLIYILLLSYGFSNLNRINRKESEKIVLLSYLPILILWVVLVMFISIDASL
jgi:hypothetical protein